MAQSDSNYAFAFGFDDFVGVYDDAWIREDFQDPAIDIDAEFRIVTGDPDADEHHDDDGGPAAIVRLLAPTEKDEWDEDLLRTFEDAERALGVVDGEPFTTEGDPEIPIAEFQALNLTSSTTVLR